MSVLLAETDADVRTLTLNRPDKRNALSAELVEALIEGVDHARRDGIRLLVLRGEGKSFSAGFDFGGFEEQSEGDLLLRFVRIETLLQAVAHAPFPTLAFAHGRNFGAGVDLFGACSRRVADPDANFLMPGLGFGLVLGTRRYAAMVGTARALQVLGEAVTFTADEALADGFATGIAPVDAWPEVLAQAGEASTRLAAGPLRCLLDVTRPDTRDADLADLVRSAALPGIKERIRAYRAG